MPRSAKSAFGPGSWRILPWVAVLGLCVVPGTSSAKLKSGLTSGTKVLHHTADGDEDCWEIKGVEKGKYQIKNTTDGTTVVMVHPGTSEAWCVPGDVKTSRPIYDKWAKEEALKIGENYLSADYQQLNTLLPAFETLGIKPAQIRDSRWSVPSDKMDKLVEAWQKIARERKYTFVESIDAEYVGLYLAKCRAILQSWEDFADPEVKFKDGFFKQGFVFRGDSVFLYASYDFLDPKKYSDGEHNINKDIEWPSFLSTSVADPKKHNFINAKSVLWQIEIEPGHPGKILGGNNPSEAEVTFAPGTILKIGKVLVRKNSKTAMASELGDKAEIIIFAKIEAVKK